MTSRNTKSTWELAGRLSSSFTQSTKQAQSQLSQLRREYQRKPWARAAPDARALCSRRPPSGTDAYANAAATDPAAAATAHRSGILHFCDVQKAGNWAPPAPRPADGERVSGRAGSALRALSGFGLAAGAGIGVAGCRRRTLLTKNLNSRPGQEAQRHCRPFPFAALTPPHTSRPSQPVDRYSPASAATAPANSMGSVARRGAASLSGGRWHTTPEASPVNSSGRSAGLGFDSIAREFAAGHQGTWPALSSTCVGSSEGATRDPCRRTIIRGALSVAAGH